MKQFVFNVILKLKCQESRNQCKTQNSLIRSMDSKADSILVPEAVTFLANIKNGDLSVGPVHFPPPKIAIHLGRRKKRAPDLGIMTIEKRHKETRLMRIEED